MLVTMMCWLVVVTKATKAMMIIERLSKDGEWHAKRGKDNQWQCNVWNQLKLKEVTSLQRQFCDKWVQVNCSTEAMQFATEVFRRAVTSPSRASQRGVCRQTAQR